MGQAEVTFRAMGSDCHVLVATEAPDDEAASALAALAVERAELLEQCWSRFRSDSELNRLNAAAGGDALPVSDDLFTLVAHMRSAWESSGGRFDPTVLSSMTALGYDADFATVSGRTAAASVVTLAPAPGMAAVALDPQHRTVALPLGVGIDPGAIGKGLGGDIIADEIIAGEEITLRSLLRSEPILQHRLLFLGEPCQQSG